MARPADAQPTNRAEPNSYLQGVGRTASGVAASPPSPGIPTWGRGACRLWGAGTGGLPRLLGPSGKFGGTPIAPPAFHPAHHHHPGVPAVGLLRTDSGPFPPPAGGGGPGGLPSPVGRGRAVAATFVSVRLRPTELPALRPPPACTPPLPLCGTPLPTRAPRLRAFAGGAPSRSVRPSAPPPLLRFQGPPERPPPTRGFP